VVVITVDYVHGGLLLILILVSIGQDVTDPSEYALYDSAQTGCLGPIRKVTSAQPPHHSAAFSRTFPTGPKPPPSAEYTAQVGREGANQGISNIKASI
jgi:hypothetical protein